MYTHNKGDVKHMTIKEVIRRTGLSRKAIYIYEDRGLIEPAKSKNGYRDYSDADLLHLLLIAKLRELELPLEDIAQIFQEPARTDLLIQKHFDQMQTRLQEVVQKISRLQTILYNLPPNGHLQDFVKAANIAMPDELAVSQARYLSEDFPTARARRFAMQLFEAFLDVPLDTPERWNAWYDLLEQIDQTDAGFWEGNEEYYGSLTARQRYEDFQLRRQLVTSYTRYTRKDEQAKAAEILDELAQLPNDPRKCQAWRRFYRLVVRPVLDSRLEISEAFSTLSTVYHTYNQEFQKIWENDLVPRLETDSGQELCRRLQTVLGDSYDLSLNALIYFDFYNNTLGKMTT